MIAIIDYGAGNLKSVTKAFDYLNVESKIVSDPKEINNADKIVLPGVGAFGSAIKEIHEADLTDFIRNWIFENRPFLGICLGMQLLLESSTESEGKSGLAVFKGECLRFDQGKVPQIGWNQIQIKKKSKLLN